MKNNKGFSLVELIIVIAIMAILVGVMAPQLIKYIEKTNVSSDIQLCKTIKTAMETACTDAEVANDTDYTPFAEGDDGEIKSLTSSSKGKVWYDSFEETLGVKNVADVNKQIKSTLGKKSTIEYLWVADGSVVVYIPNTRKDGAKKDGKALSTKECIYAGPVELKY